MGYVKMNSLPVLHDAAFAIVTVIGGFFIGLSFMERKRRGDGALMRYISILLLLLYYTSCHFWYQWNWCDCSVKDDPQIVRVTIPEGEDCTDYMFEIAEATGIDPADMSKRNCD